MRAVRSKDTAPERRVRHEVFRRGFRYRLHDRRVPGSPDLIFPRHRIVVFVHGCFWHGHDCPKGRRPKSNMDFWNEKLDRNAVRDQAVVDELEGAGWEVVTIWECQIPDGIDSLLRRLTELRDAEREGVL
jgi:DNA mismatch endonuclease (patch repair protein)